ncbi:hypothetical protein BD410DRAFT_845986 [Rickenella mellea]|uniref:Uncharacterized protein n=1 Tax=Rickenella mellea TaxID=50990 RepID=A0A4Y7PGK3_9AGAM|nr:hypothetical protein BD410DRAFT_845986 [Rickenella mellea]
MSVALALYCISCRLEGVQALPVTVARRATSSCDDSSNCRTSSHIIWSCLATIFSCTMFAIHPSIPAPYESSFEVGLRRFGIFVMTLITPELVIMWAMKQWIVSRRLAKKYHTVTKHSAHLPDELNELYKEGEIAFPTITKREIEDKSKGDVISKGFVILQTSWFVLQYVARGVERLPITELELVTLAFAVLNLATYALWRNKPLNVQRPFAIHVSNNVHELAPYKQTRGGSSPIELGLGGIVELVDALQSWNMAFAGTAVSVIFGALHCIAWSFKFPSHEMQILWRTCSLAITCLPATLVFCAKLWDVLTDLELDFVDQFVKYFSGTFLAIVLVFFLSFTS